MWKVLGYVWLKSLPSTEIRERANSVCAEDACRCWTVSAVASGRVVERVAGRNCGSTIGREESVRPCGPSSGLQSNEAARCESVLDGINCCNLERGRSVCWCTENTLDELPEDDGQKHHGGRIGCGVGGSFGVCGIKGVLGRECKTCDRTQICSSQQMSGEGETCSEIFMAPQIVEAEHCKDYNVAGLPLEFECLDDSQGPKRQNCKLECEDGGERYWREEAAVDGIGPVVETLALVIGGSRRAT